MERQLPRFEPCSRSTCVLQVFSYREKCICGQLYNPQTQTIFPFSNLMQLLLCLDGLLDRFDLPQRGMEARSFQPRSTHPISPAADHAASEPPLASFQVTVLFRQHASWQGILVWNEQQLEARFRSALELISLLDDALTPLSDG